MKDLFSANSALYQKARPQYPEQIIQAILSQVSAYDTVWDCGAGSGQLTTRLAPYFRQVIATDLSAEQLARAPQLANVDYRVQAAEQAGFGEIKFDLITVAQAIHWFNFADFYPHVKQYLKPDGRFVVLGYGLLHLEDPDLNQVIQHLYYTTLKGYWEPERKHIDELYQNIPFPFEEIQMPQFLMNYHWTLAQLKDYLKTWSAVQAFEARHGVNPVDALDFPTWPHHAEVALHFPILLRIGKLNDNIKGQAG